MIFDTWNIRSDKHGPVAYCYYGNFGAKPRGILNKEDYDVPATIEDQAVLNFIKNIEI